MQTENLIGEFRPVTAIVVYEREGKDFYLESHGIDEQGRILEGRPLLQETINEMVEFFYTDQEERVSTRELLPGNVLYYRVLTGGHLAMIWHRPAEQRVLHFTDSLKIPSGKAWVPPMIYATDGKSLSVYALDPKALDLMPAHDTVLYRAPFHNVSGGSVCLGSGQLQKPRERSIAGWMKYWEDFFWMTEFSHLSSDSPTKTNINLLWMDLIANPAKTWADLDELKAENKTLKSLIKW